MSPFEAESFLLMFTEEEIEEIWMQDRDSTEVKELLLPRFRSSRLRICCYKMGFGPRVGLPWAP